LRVKLISLEKIKEILNNKDPKFVEGLAREADKITKREFGRAVSLYAPIYISNYCENNCVYCGFRVTNKFKREKLSPEEIDREMKIVAERGIRNILILTGESRSMSSVSYILESVEIAKKYFSNINLEIYPLEVEEYREFFLSGVDGITVYQETYDRERYKILHLAGKKRDYNYRYETPERIAKSGIRMISMGVLLGLSEVAEDVHRLFLHMEELEKKFPGVEYSISFPRIILSQAGESDYFKVTDLDMVKLISLARIVFPRVGINLSTREPASFRDHALNFGVTKISAASNTSVGGYSKGDFEDPQFDILDKRSLDEIVNVLIERGFDPVFTDWRRIENTVF